MKANILVIDDELNVRRSCEKILNGDGYNVATAPNGREGLEKARTGNFDLAIVDLKMPDIDGMDVVEAIKAERPGMAVIIMTGYSTVPSAVKGMKLGAADYIPKPFTPDEMSEAVRKALKQREYRAITEEPGLLINKEAIVEVLTRAAEDKDFVAELSDSGADALEDYDLSPEEKAALVSVVQPSDEETIHVVSHELKSPLASIATLARAIQEPDVPGDQKQKFLGRIISRAESGLSMIDEYLTLSAIGAGELEIAPQRVNFYAEVIEKVMDDQKEAMDGRNISASIEIPTDLEVVCDPKYMRVVYNNLISNAVKYGTAETEIYIGYHGLWQGYHYFNVANVGEWIKEDDRKRIFEKYVTLGKRGTGIGLHATIQIVKAHGGDIWVEPCYFFKGVCIPASSVIAGTEAEDSSDRLIPGNNFVFTISEKGVAAMDNTIETS